MEKLKQNDLEHMAVGGPICVSKSKEGAAIIMT